MMKRWIAILGMLCCSHQVWAQRSAASLRSTYDGDVAAVVGIKPALPYARPGGSLGYWGVGNGGDWMRIGFARAREYAAQVVLRIKPDSLRNIPQPEIRQWILDNQKFLAADILQSEHVWELEAKPTCAWTLSPGTEHKVPTAFPIQFSYPTCRGQADSFQKAAQILIHEAVHHFNGDETTADRVAIGILDAWQKGLMDQDPVELLEAPAGVLKHAAVWTGKEMITFGGLRNELNQAVNTASAFDPATRSWRDLGAPKELKARYDAQMVWTGSEVFLWGGFRTQGDRQEWLYDGALYNPTTGQWTLLSAPASWTPRALLWDQDPRQTLAWTGDQVLVFGGIDDNTQRALAASFDPKKRSWSSLNTEGAPLRVGGHSSVWTGDSLIIWGGYKGLSDISRELTQEGSVFNLATQSWSALPTQAAPSSRAGHQAV